MSAIVPAILPRSLAELEEKLAQFAGIADFVQIDVTDGVFAYPASWPCAEGKTTLRDMVAKGETLPQWGKLKFDIDLMTERPEESLDDWIALGADRVTIHAESTRFLSRLIKDFDTRYGHSRDFSLSLVEIGLAIGLSTDVALIEPYLDRIDYVQFMGIAHIGQQGQPFDRRVIERIHAFHKRHPDIDIQIDGGISRNTAPDLLSAGAHRLIVGSDLIRARDPKMEFDALEELIEEYGIYE